MYKIAKIALFAFSIISFLLCVVLVGYYMGVEDAKTAPVPFTLDGMFFAAYIIFILSIVIAFAVALVATLNEKGALVEVLKYVGLFAVIAIVSYVLSLGESTGTEKFVSAGLIMFYIFAAIAMGAVIFTEVKNALKR